MVFIKYSKEKTMANWLQSSLDDLAKFVERDTVELAEKAADALLPNLAQDLTPIVQKAVVAALGTFPFGTGLAPYVSDAVAKLVSELVTVIEDHLNAGEASAAAEEPVAENKTVAAEKVAADKAAAEKATDKAAADKTAAEKATDKAAADKAAADAKPVDISKDK